MDTLVESAAMALARLCGDEENWRDGKYVLPATAVIENIAPHIVRKEGDLQPPAPRN